MRNLLIQIAFTHQRRHLAADIPLLHRALFLPVLSFASSVFKISIRARIFLYRWGVFEKKRLPVPVISVGNLTWGGNGKTPMVEFLSVFFSEMGVSPLVLTRGYAGGDEAKMLVRHLSHTNAKIGVGADRAAIAARLFQKYGYADNNRIPRIAENEKISVAILDDGMQHWSLSRDLDIVMINGLMPWGNNHLIPRGSLREELIALERVDIAVIHHADLMEPLYVDRLSFGDHYFIRASDIEMIKERVERLELEFRSTKSIIVVTEKDYDRDPIILNELNGFCKVLVLCSSLQIVPLRGGTDNDFKHLVKELLFRTETN